MWLYRSLNVLNNICKYIRIHICLLSVMKQQNDNQLIIVASRLYLYLQNRMNYELRAVRFDYSCSIFGAEDMRQISPLETRTEKKALYQH